MLTAVFAFMHSVTGRWVAIANRVPETDLDAFHTAAAAQILTGQSHEVASLREAGIMLIDTPPDLLTERLISEFLSIKARNLM